MDKDGIVKWLSNSNENESYQMTTWYRCVNIQKFIEKVEEDDEIVGIIFSDNNIGFILKGKNGQKI